MSFLQDNKQIIAYVVGLLTIVTTGMGATWFLGQRFERIQNQVDVLTEDNYTLTQASEQAFRTAVANPGMRIPDPRDPDRIIVVEIPRKDKVDD